MTKFREKESVTGLMAENMRDSSKTVSFMVLVCILGQMEKSTEGNIKTISSKATEYSYGQTVENSKEIGDKAKCTGKES
jgi:hypothetical protein